DGAQVTFTERAFPCQRAARAVVARALTPSVRPREVRLCEDAIRLVPGGCGQEQALVAVAACLDRAGHTRCTAGRSRQYIDHPADRVTPVEGSHRTLHHLDAVRLRDRKSTRLNSSHVKISYA